MPKHINTNTGVNYYIFKMNFIKLGISNKFPMWKGWYWFWYQLEFIRRFDQILCKRCECDSKLLLAQLMIFFLIIITKEKSPST